MNESRMREGLLERLLPKEPCLSRVVIKFYERVLISNQMSLEAFFLLPELIDEGLG